VGMDICPSCSSIATQYDCDRCEFGKETVMSNGSVSNQFSISGEFPLYVESVYAYMRRLGGKWRAWGKVPRMELVDRLRMALWSVEKVGKAVSDDSTRAVLAYHWKVFNQMKNAVEKTLVC